VIIAIDAGHGGRDPGAVASDGTHEADITMPVAEMVADIVREAGHDAVLTRPHVLTLSARAKYANRKRADRFVSIHCNAAAHPTARGIETYHFPGSLAGVVLASQIQIALVEAFPTARNRGVKESNFAVLRLTNAPAVLVEMEFITNPKAREQLLDPVMQMRYAVAIAHGAVEVRL
jgi:N-acetylmuramoyl-L-alanine amidase